MSILVSLYLASGSLILMIQAEAGSADSTVGGLSLPEMFRRMGLPAKIIAAVLALMSIYSISVMIERWLTFNSAKNQSKQFIPKAGAALRDRQIKEAITLTEQHKKSHLAIVINAGLQEYLVQQQAGQTSGFADDIRDAVERAKAIKAAELSRGLPGLATIGSTAPFVGLLGTVIGIINAFQSMRLAEGTGIDVVAGGISEALVETAFGLIVAIPAVWSFNKFSSRLESFKIEMNNSSSELMVYLKRHGRERAKLTDE